MDFFSTSITAAIAAITKVPSPPISGLIDPVYLGAGQTQFIGGAGSTPANAPSVLLTRSKVIVSVRIGINNPFGQGGTNVFLWVRLSQVSGGAIWTYVPLESGLNLTGLVGDFGTFSKDYLVTGLTLQSFAVGAYLANSAGTLWSDGYVTVAARFWEGD